MNTDRDSLSPAARERYEQAIKDAGQLLRNACDRRDRLAAEKGPRAVAEAAWHPGHRLGTVEAIEAYYRSLQDRERERLGRKVA